MTTNTVDDARLPELPPLPNANYAGIFTPEQMYAYAREAIALTAAGAGGEAVNWQQRCLDIGFKYWRAPDAHGVECTHEQALALLRDLLGVEVDFTTPPPAPVGDALTWLYTHCLAIGMKSKSDSGSMEHDIALFTVELNDARARPAPDMAALVEKWRKFADWLNGRDCADELEAAFQAPEGFDRGIRDVPDELIPE